MLTFKQQIAEDNIDRMGRVISYLSNRLQGQTHEEASKDIGPYGDVIKDYATASTDTLKAEHARLSHRYDFISDLDNLF